MGYFLIGLSIFFIILGFSRIFLKKTIVRFKFRSSIFSKVDEGRFDEKKENFLVGIYLIFIGVLPLLIYFFKDNTVLYTILINIFMLLSFCFLICMRIFTRKRTQSGSLPPLTKSDKLYLILTIIFSILVLAFINILNFIGGVESRISGNNILINSRKISIESVEEIEYRNNFDVGTRISGMSNMKVEKGKYKNSEFGEYRADLNKLPKMSAIIIKTKDKTTVFNSETEDKTEKLYKDIKENMQKIKP